MARRDQIETVVREHFRIVAEGELEAMDENVTADFLNIRSADLRFEIHDVVIEGDRIAALVTMRGRQHGTFIVYNDESGNVTDVFPATGRALAVRQTHWFRIRDGRISEHDAIRDDLEMAKQLKWLPPTPVYLVRMFIALRRERRRQQPSAGAFARLRSSTRSGS